MVEHIPVTEQFKDLVFDTILNIKDALVGFINEILGTIAPNFSVELVFVIAVLLGIVIKRWKKLNTTETILISLLIFFSLRFLGVG